MEIIKNKIRELKALCDKYPTKIPCEEAAKFLEMDLAGLRSALVRGNAPFGFGYQRKDGGNRAYHILTMKFYLWCTNQTAQMVMGTCLQ